MHVIGQSARMRGSRPQGPLVPYMDAFKRRSVALGYAPTTVRMQAPLISGFSKWLGQKKIAIENISSDHMERYLRYRARHRYPRSDDVATLRRLLDLLREEGIIAEQRACRDATPVQRLLDEYTCYLLQERALSPRTLIYYLGFAGSFLEQKFGEGKPEMSSLRAADVIKFVQHQVACRSRGAAKNLTTALRSFLRYARYRGYITIDLTSGVPAVANWSMPSIPRSIDPGHVRRVLAQCNRRTAVGSRDYAILLLLSRLGLRASAVAFLELEDIDWEAGTLSVRGKDSHVHVLPLPIDVGKAIAAYLKKRPVSTSRRVFLRSKAPLRGFKTYFAVVSVVKNAMTRAGIDSPRKGAHQFRHALACEMLSKGSSLPEIGQILGHRSPQSTAIYAKVDLAPLRTIALPWPGEVR
jgi:integrase/recombinase XerD